ncbi:hypothetical protein PINS_up003968 [Pythium insidiosum]|nr:hypothetical protein PINS_up003968 [Pythium insidiosum]
MIPLQADDRGAVMTVLTNRRLLLQITARMDGMPGLVYQMRTSKADDMPVRRAVESGSIRALEMLHEWSGSSYSVRRFERGIRDALDEAIKCGNVDIVRWMLQRFATPSIGPALWRDALGQTPCNVAVLETLYAFFPNVRVRDARVHDIAAIQWLLDHDIDCKVSSRIVREAVEGGTDAFVQRLIERDLIQDYSPVLVAAAAASKWSIFFQLSERCTKIHQPNGVLAALDQAVIDRNFAVVQTLCQLKLQSPPTKAIDLAITNGFLEIVRFFFAKYKKAFSVNEVERAAASGQLEVLKFLLAKDDSTCAASALYSAASSGHLDVVRFLVERGIDANIDTALSNAVQSQRKEVVAYLLPLSLQGCDRRQWSTLLKLGFVTEWKELVSRFPPSDLGLELTNAMRTAARDGWLSVIRFIHCELARHDLAVYAMEEAATVGHAGWITAVYNLTRQAPTLLTLKNAVMAASSYASWMTPKQERVEALSRLVRWCVCAVTRDEVLKHATQHYHAEITEVIEASMVTRTDAPTSVGTLGLLDKLGNVEDWVVEALLAPNVQQRLKLQAPAASFGAAREEEPKNVDKWNIGVQTLPKQAIERGDLATLQQLYRAMLNDPSLSGAPELSFEDVAFAAIASGNLSIIQWILSTLFPSLAEEENLLEHAVFHGQHEVAHWLGSRYPQSRQLPLQGDRFCLRPDGDCTPAILEWLDRVAAPDSHLQQFLSWTGIVDDIVVLGDVVLLQYVIKHHPEALESIDDPLLVAAHFGHVKILSVLLHLPAAADVDTAAIQDAASTATQRNHTHVLECLLERYPSVDYSDIALEAAHLVNLRALFLFLEVGAVVPVEDLEGVDRLQGAYDTVVLFRHIRCSDKRSLEADDSTIQGPSPQKQRAR